MISNEILAYMQEIDNIKEEDLFVTTVSISNISMEKIRDFIMLYGTVVKEDLSNNIYIGYFKKNRMSFNRILIGFQLKYKNLTIVSFYKKISTSKRKTDEVIQLLTQNKKKTKYLKRFIFVIICIVSMIILYLGVIMVPSAQNATLRYNETVLKFNKAAKEYNNLIEKISVDNVEGMPGETTLLKTENEGYLDVFLSVIHGNNSTKIKNDIKTMNNMIDILQDYGDVAKKINNPSRNFVENLLENIDEIDKIESVNENNDPNGFLGEKNGYTSCTYFTIKGLELSENNSSSPVKLGTDGGGCIEVYADAKDALARCEYLQQFDNTILYSGSYALVGTMVIRTSYVLTDEQQYTLTNYIIEEFTK